MHASPSSRGTLFHDKVKDKSRPLLMLVWFIREWMGITINIINSIEETTNGCQNCNISRILIFVDMSR